MTLVMNQMSSDRTFVDELHTVRLICFDIYNTYMLEKVRELDPETYLNLFQNFDLHYQILERVGLTRDNTAQGQLLAWYTEEVNRVCILYSGNHQLDVKSHAARIYCQLKERLKSIPQSQNVTSPSKNL